jgi:hypothetical protein
MPDISNCPNHYIDHDHYYGIRNQTNFSFTAELNTIAIKPRARVIHVVGFNIWEELVDYLAYTNL